MYKGLVKCELYQNRILYLDILRIISSFGIMILHLSSSYWNEVNALSFDWKIFNIYDSCTRWGVPVFIMISGYLFLNRNSSDDIKKVHKKNIVRIITCFCFWSLIYTIYDVIVHNFGLKTAMINFIKGQNFMWFLFMIVGIYLIIPFLRKIVQSEYLLKYFLILSFVFSVLLPQMIVFVGLKNADYQSILNEIYEKIEFKFAYGYVFYFVLGYYLGSVQINQKKRFFIYILGLLGFIGTVITSELLTDITGKANGIFYDNFSFGIMFESISVFVFARFTFSKIKLNKFCNNSIVVLSNISFGAFLVHILIINILDTLFKLNVLTFNPIFSIPVLGLIVFMVSFFISYILHKVPFIGKYIV